MNNMKPNQACMNRYETSEVSLLVAAHALAMLIISPFLDLMTPAAAGPDHSSLQQDFTFLSFCELTLSVFGSQACHLACLVFSMLASKSHFLKTLKF